MITNDNYKKFLYFSINNNIKQILQKLSYTDEEMIKQTFKFIGTLLHQK